MKILLTLIYLICLNLSSNAQERDSFLLSRRLLEQEFVVFNSSDTLAKYVAIYNKAMLYKQNCKYPEAVYELERMEKWVLYTHDSIEYEKAFCLLMTRRYNEAYNEIIGMADSNRNNNINTRFLWLVILAENKLWLRCKNELLAIVEPGNDLYEQVKRLPYEIAYKSPYKASKLSSFVPGLGQIYAKSPGKGLVSFGLHLGFITWTGFEYANGFFFCGSESGILPLIKFYKGGKAMSYNLTDNYNIQQEQNLKEQYLQCISQVLKK